MSLTLNHWQQSIRIISWRVSSASALAKVITLVSKVIGTIILIFINMSRGYGLNSHEVGCRVGCRVECKGGEGERPLQGDMPTVGVAANCFRPKALALEHRVSSGR